MAEKIDWDGLGIGKLLGKVRDTEIMKDFKIARETIAKERRRRGLPRVGGSARSWSEEDYQWLMEALKTIGRTPQGLYHEDLRRRTEAGLTGGRGYKLGVEGVEAQRKIHTKKMPKVRRTRNRRAR